MPRDGAQARDRLREAALELYGRCGYDRTTTAEIAARAGVTERTYFRHFADKREVLFDGEAELRTILTDAVAVAPPGLGPLPTLIRALTAAVPLLVASRTVAERRARVIEVTPALRERAQAKTAALVDALTDALSRRGVDPGTARLAADVGMAAFAHASRRWGEDPTIDLAAAIREAGDAALSLGRG